MFQIIDAESSGLTETDGAEMAGDFEPMGMRGFDRGCELVKINMEPGDFVLWDSRTMHYARLPEGNQIRHVQYICMTPRRFATEESLKLKAECFNKWIGTTHWPHW